jgi:hypothetical protein
MKVGRYEENVEEGTFQPVYERDLPDEGPIDPPLVMKAGEWWGLEFLTDQPLHRFGCSTTR